MTPTNDIKRIAETINSDRKWVIAEDGCVYGLYIPERREWFSSIEQSDGTWIKAAKAFNLSDPAIQLEMIEYLLDSELPSFRFKKTGKRYSISWLPVVKYKWQHSLGERVYMNNESLAQCVTEAMLKQIDIREVE